jgi:6-phosphogluconolactonase (cycloisomerase 2 family)
MGAKFGRLLILVASLGVGLVAAAAAGPSSSPSPSVSQSACVFDNRYTFSSEPCAPFTRVGIKIRAAIPATAFGADTPPSEIGALDDGSVIVQTDRSGEYRIVDGRLTPLWHPNPRCASSVHFDFSLVQAFDNKLLVTIWGRHQVAHESLFSPYQDGSAIVRSDGSLAFRSPLVFESAAQDSSGVTWLLQGRAPNQTLYALLPNLRDLETVPFSEGIYRLFRSPNGHVYVTNFSGLYELATRPSVRAHLVHAPIQPVKPSPGLESDDHGWPIQAVGADGSLWASTPTQVIHVHPNGTMRVMRLMRPPNMVTHPLPIISLTMTRDGAVWNAWGNLVRIGNDDRIEVMDLPKTSEANKVKFGPDSSMWMLVHDAETDQARGVVNFVPAVTAHGAVAWPFKPVGSTPKPTPVLAPCPPPSTPIPPLPPQRGPVNFVYVANVMSHDVWGYWTDAKGNLTPVRGSPFTVAAENFTIDASGRHLYVGTWYDGIFAYTIDVRSGALSPIVGSPFKTAVGPSTVVIDHNGRYAYSADLNGKSFSGYAINRINGALHPLAWSPFALDRWPFRLTINPQRNVAYFVTNRGIEMFEASGDAPKPTLSIPLKNFGGINVLIDRRGRWAYFASDDDGTISIYSIDPRSGALMPPTSPPVKAGNEPRAMAISPSGRFFYVTNIPKIRNGPTILGFRVDSRTGALRKLPTSPFSGAAAGNGLTITPDGAFLYATNFSGKTIAGFAIDQLTGALWRLPNSPFKAGDTPGQIVSCQRIGDSCKATP